MAMIVDNNPAPPSQPPASPRTAHSLICCDMDHGSSSTPVPAPTTACPSPCPFETYCCLDEHCEDACEDQNCAEVCAEPCFDAECEQAECCPAECCDDPTCDPTVSHMKPHEHGEWCPTGCTIEEFLQCCSDACSLAGVPLNLESQSQPQLQHQSQNHTPSHPALPTPPYYDLVAAALSATTSATRSTVAAPPPTPVVPPGSHVCHWQNCHRSFGTMTALLEHLATEHLGASTTTLETVSAPTMEQPLAVDAAPQSGLVLDLGMGNDLNNSVTGQQHATVSTSAHSGDLLPCLWDDCFTIDPSIVQQPGATQFPPANAHGNPHAHGHGHGHSHTHAETGEPLSPQTMLRHLLEEHIGVTSDLWGSDFQTLMSQSANAPQAQMRSQPPTPLAPAPTPEANYAHHLHHHAHAHLHHNKPYARPAHVHRHAPHVHTHQPVKLPPSPSPSVASGSALSTVSSAGNHVCLWPGCTREPFATSGDLMEHLSEDHIGRGVNEYRCLWDGCGGPGGRAFSSRQKVLRHLQSHTGHRPFRCAVCGQTFCEAAPLAAHMRRHADDKPFVCDYPGCGKAFAISSSLTIHRRTHLGVRPFVCPHCGKGFVEASNLTKHIRTHTGERPFACTHPGCGKRFSRPDQLKRHMSVHSGGGRKKAGANVQKVKGEVKGEVVTVV